MRAAAAAGAELTGWKARFASTLLRWSAASLDGEEELAAAAVVAAARCLASSSAAAAGESSITCMLSRTGAWATRRSTAD